MDYKEEISLLLDIVMKKGHGSAIHVPMFSMRSYDTNKYDLTCDGNMNRLVSVWLNVIKERSLREDEYRGFPQLDIRVVIPSADDMTPQSIDFLQKVEEAAGGHLTFMYDFSYPPGGPKVIRSLSGTLETSQSLTAYLRAVNYKTVVVYEPEYIGIILEAAKKTMSVFEDTQVTTVFWCPVSDTASVMPPFLENVRYVDRELAMTCDFLMVATKKQEEYFSKYRGLKPTILMEMLIDPSLPLFAYEEDKEMTSLIDKHCDRGEQVIYFPFRMSDPGYKFKEIIEVLGDISALYPIVVLYTDPNDTADLMPLGEVNIDFIKVPKKRDSYYTCISDKRCIIPYFEDIESIMHASWQEMKYYGSTLATHNGYMVYLNDKEEIYESLIGIIESRAGSTT